MKETLDPRYNHSIIKHNIRHDLNNKVREYKKYRYYLMLKIVQKLEYIYPKKRS